MPDYEMERQTPEAGGVRLSKVPFTMRCQFSYASLLRASSVIAAIFSLVIVIVMLVTGGGLGGLMPAILLVGASRTIFRMGTAVRGYIFDGKKSLLFYIGLLPGFAFLVGIGWLLLSVGISRDAARVFLIVSLAILAVVPVFSAFASRLQFTSSEDDG